MAEYAKDPLTEKIIGCCFEVHKSLGPGFLERVYSKALQHELSLKGLQFEAEKEFNLYFKGKSIGRFKCDLYIENKVIVELKSFSGIYTPVLFQKQILSYLKASNTKTGLLINFGNVSCSVKRFSV